MPSPRLSPGLVCCSSHRRRRASRRRLFDRAAARRGDGQAAKRSDAQQSEVARCKAPRAVGLVLRCCLVTDVVEFNRLDSIVARQCEYHAAFDPQEHGDSECAKPHRRFAVVMVGQEAVAFRIIAGLIQGLYAIAIGAGLALARVGPLPPRAASGTGAGLRPHRRSALADRPRTAHGLGPVTTRDRPVAPRPAAARPVPIGHCVMAAPGRQEQEWALLTAARSWLAMHPRPPGAAR